MFQFLYFTQLTLFLAFVLTTVVVYILYNRKRYCDKEENNDNHLFEPPSPMGLPIIGHLHLLHGYEIPYQAFTKLGQKYGNVIKLKLGFVDSIVVNGQECIKEILITKGYHFDNRPNFERYQQLFGGNKENSLAFCDWSTMQRSRREMLRIHTFPRAFTNKFTALEDLISGETNKLLLELPLNVLFQKSLILQTCANIFIGHFCSKTFPHHNPDFKKMVENFDQVFYEVNQGYAADFLPFLLPFHYKNITKMNNLAHEIRTFIEKHVIQKRFEEFQYNEPEDFVDSLAKHVKDGEEPKFDWNTALFALEDVIGGHSAVGNFFLKLLAFLVNEPEVQRKIQVEIDSVTESIRPVKLSDRTKCPYTEGAIFEAIRLIASPIVPRVANQDTTINGFKIKKDSLVFLNNYDLSMSKDLWEEPERFKPERFVVDNQFIKPQHFLPFGGGRRSCMGYKMVQFVAFGMLSRILQTFTIKPVNGACYKVPIGSLALPKDTFEFTFEKRT